MAKPYSDYLRLRASGEPIAAVRDDALGPTDVRATVSAAVAAERLALVRGVMIGLFVAPLIAALPTWLLYVFLVASRLFQ